MSNREHEIPGDLTAVQVTGPATVTLHGLLPPAEPTLELVCSLRTERFTNGFTGREETHEILRAANGPYIYEWRLSSMLDLTDENMVGQPGGFWITGFDSAIAQLLANAAQTAVWS